LEFIGGALGSLDLFDPFVLIFFLGGTLFSFEGGTLFSSEEKKEGTVGNILDDPDFDPFDPFDPGFDPFDVVFPISTLCGSFLNHWQNMDHTSE